ncbi:hypothetical protein Moror_8482 [Moniliophthora roreri MCA 2997]|uniref:Uncharacterized protein n=2 Tax=Moniliophthora roreri TaxID=221103 RepID=V2WL55_MONRO|nr:hypothetical protein Moror_8482 [Moniliophthora roreri MCA 2997]
MGSPFQMTRTSVVPTNQHSSLQYEDTDEEFEEWLRSLMDSSSSTSNSERLISPRPTQPNAWMYLASVPEGRECHPYPSVNETLSIPHSQLLHNHPPSTSIENPLQNPLYPELQNKLGSSPMSLLQLPRPKCPEPLTPQFSTPLPMLVSPPLSMPLPLHHLIQELQPESHQNSPPPLSQQIQTQVPHIVSVWDNEDEDLDNRDLQIESRSISPTPIIMERIVEVYMILNALCAEWGITAPSTVEAIVVQFVDSVRLGISLKTAITDEGLLKLCNRTIPAVIQLLTTIGETITIGMTRSMEMENPERRQEPPPAADGLTIDIGELEGLRTFFFTLMNREAVGQWLVRGEPLSNVDV